MKITIYELLGLIKDGKAPKKIKVTGNIYEFDESYDMYYTHNTKGNYVVALGGMTDEINLIANAFNDNVEIIEEDKKIEKIKIDNQNRIQALSTGNFVYKVNQPTKIIIYKINELIDEINKLKEKK